MRVAIRTFRQLLDLALIALVVVVLGTVIAVNVAPKLGHELIVIRGGSMEPAIHLGAAVDITPTAVAELKVGDIVTIKGTNGVLVTHRIVEIHPTADTPWVRLKGDANRVADQRMPASLIVGRVTGDVPLLGYLMYMLMIPTGIASIFMLAAVMLLSIWLLEDLEEEEVEDEAGEDVEFGPTPRPQRPSRAARLLRSLGRPLSGRRRKPSSNPRSIEAGD